MMGEIIKFNKVGKLKPVPRNVVAAAEIAGATMVACADDMVDAGVPECVAQDALLSQILDIYMDGGADPEWLKNYVALVIDLIAVSGEHN